MIAVDSNVLVRLFVNDDQRQHDLVVQFFDGRNEESPAYISTVVLVEFIWVLQRSYKHSRDQVLSAISWIVESRDAVLEQHDDVAHALSQARDTPRAGITDLLIARCAVTAGCEKVVTFDKAAAKAVETMDLLK